jgi:hypothetical protein
MNCLKYVRRESNFRGLICHANGNRISKKELAKLVSGKHPDRAMKHIDRLFLNGVFVWDGRHIRYDKFKEKMEAAVRLTQDQPQNGPEMGTKRGHNVPKTGTTRDQDGHVSVPRRGGDMYRESESESESELKGGSPHDTPPSAGVQNNGKAQELAILYGQRNKGPTKVQDASRWFQSALDQGFDYDALKGVICDPNALPGASAWQIVQHFEKRASSKPKIRKDSQPYKDLDNEPAAGSE